MQVEKQKLLAAAKKVGISPTSAEELWAELEPSRSRTFDLSTILYYCGALIVILGMGWVLGNAWTRIGGTTLFFIALAYILIFLFAGLALVYKTAFKVAGGLFITIAVSLIPIAIYGLQKWSGWGLMHMPPEYQDFPQLTLGGKLFMQAATALGGLIALRWIRFPFLIVPILIALWFFALTLIPLVWGHRANSFKGKAWLSVVFGLGTLLWAYIMDLESHKKFAFWGYLLGILAFWGALLLLYIDMRISSWLFALINVGLILLSVLLQRGLFLLMGALGILVLIIELFYHSLWFPLIMSLIGVSVIVLGILYRKWSPSSLLDRFPETVTNWLPKK